VTRYVLDASVAIAANRPKEPAFARSSVRLARALAGEDELVLPVTFGIEVAGAMGRAGLPAADVRTFLDALARSPHEVVTLGPKRARLVEAVALATKLRGADAVYVWLAAREGVPLCTLDREMTARGAAVCRIIPP
jgi:predicted nucleic acid-binding protein